VQTGKVQRRPIRLATIAEALAEAQRCADAENAGTATYLGNWTVGQILNHLGAWANFAFDGNGLHMPWFVRLFGPPMLKRFLKNGLPAGQSIPKVKGGTLATERLSADDGLVRFTHGFTRLQQNVPPDRHPLFGPMTHEQWIALNLRHAELHLSFVTYPGAGMPVHAPKH
jgi:hypothetical protein